MISSNTSIPTGKKCQAEMEVYSRVCGYHRPIKNWNKGKQEEFLDRLSFSLEKATTGKLQEIPCQLPTTEVVGL